MYSVWENPFHKRYLPETTSQKLKFLTVLRSSHFNIVSVPFFETLEDRKPHQHSPPRLIPFPPFCPLFLSFSIHYSLFSSNNTSSPFYFCRRCCPPPYSILVNGRPLGIPRDTISAASKSPPSLWTFGGNFFDRLCQIRQNETFFWTWVRLPPTPWMMLKNAQLVSRGIPYLYDLTRKTFLTFL